MQFSVALPMAWLLKRLLILGVVLSVCGGSMDLWADLSAHNY